MVKVDVDYLTLLIGSEVAKTSEGERGWGVSPQERSDEDAPRTAANRSHLERKSITKFNRAYR